MNNGKQNGINFNSNFIEYTCASHSKKMMVVATMLLMVIVHVHDALSADKITLEKSTRCGENVMLERIVIQQ